jgi:DNA (cytosine-5)-methyltransferase 1
LGAIGYECAWRMLDAQYFGLAQRRKRVFLVGYLGDWRPACAVLFERESLRRDIAPSREKGAVVAALTSTGVGTCGADDNQNLVAFKQRPEGDIIQSDKAYTLSTSGNCTANGNGKVSYNGCVRRLTPRECERLMGLPDDYTRIPWRGKPAEDCPDSHRYKAIGNSIAAPVLGWIGRRIGEVEGIKQQRGE